MENTISVKEFKAWLEGYSEAFLYKEYPSSEQWEKIRKKIEQIDSYNSYRYDPFAPQPLLRGVVGEFNPGGLAVAQDVKTSVKEAPDGPGYI